MRSSFTNFILQQQKVHTETRDVQAKVRDMCQDANLVVSTDELNRRLIAGHDDNNADSEQGAVNGFCEGAMAVGGAVALIFPIGTIIGACIVVAAAIIMAIEAIKHGNDKNNATDEFHQCDELKLLSQSSDAVVKRLDDGIKNSSDDMRTWINTVLDNMKREFDSLRGKN